jgi:hypothetical protein
MPDDMKALLSQYEDIFREPTELPPKRSCDHQITLVPGAQPVNVRPYRYAPVQKTEIERQLAEMLKMGSSSQALAHMLPQFYLSKRKMEVGGFVWIIDI